MSEDHPANVIVLQPNTSFEDLTAIVKKSGLVFADFFATWCPPCQRLISQIPSLAAEFPNVTFVKVNVDNNEALSAHFNVSSIPHIAFLKFVDGQVKTLETVVGFNLPKIKQALTTHQ
ncbi:Thioredoxin family protein [Histomonas meleagridis]|uniref:Thioredoxin family protein n=1 Tax=Histomonas meleagridis TaxID=135588 RepID=UPI00355A9DB3|nr:Thioredoxin family protein [Histomonas meleagridis]KAH0799568.1 Thioredoxin family protein [Histomonas meleagridis]